MCGCSRKTSPRFRILVITKSPLRRQNLAPDCSCGDEPNFETKSRTEIPLWRNRAESIIELGCYLSIAAASRAGLPAFLDRHSPATTLTVPATHTRPISVTIKSITVTNAITVAPVFIDADAVRTHRHVGLGQRDKIVGDGGGSCERRECCQA
jgi:hypothetical protein